MAEETKRQRQKRNRLEKLARFHEEAMAHADDDVEDGPPEYLPSEKAAARLAWRATERFRRKLKSE